MNVDRGMAWSLHPSLSLSTSARALNHPVPGVQGNKDQQVPSAWQHCNSAQYSSLLFDVHESKMKPWIFSLTAEDLKLQRMHMQSQAKDNEGTWKPACSSLLTANTLCGIPIATSLPRTQAAEPHGFLVLSTHYSSVLTMRVTTSEYEGSAKNVF